MSGTQVALEGGNVVVHGHYGRPLLAFPPSRVAPTSTRSAGWSRPSATSSRRDG